MQFSSKLIAGAVDAFASLPGIGRKTALRLALHLVQQEKQVTSEFAEALTNMREGVRECERCYNLSDEVLCNICKDTSRDHKLICVVESIRDVMAIEDTQQFRGVYHVLGGVISPIEGVGPEELKIEELIARVQTGEVKELIMAISPTIEGDTTVFYLTKQLAGLPVKVSTIARGVSFGGELEYADGVTLGRSILARTEYKVD